MTKEYNDFIYRINRKLGIDLNLYKEAQMKRRITSLRDKRGFATFTSYYEALNNEELLLKEFVDRLTINVSEFYRNPKRWDVLQKTILPLLVNQKQQQLSIWSAACSTGEEPYTIAIMMKELFPDVDFSITATDIDESALHSAKQGVYKEQALKELPQSIKKKYFTKKNGLYDIDYTIKQLVTFKKHNLLADKYPRNIDLIVCRNVLIYFTDTAKDIIYRNFSACLNKDGVLFVGSTEQIFSANKYDLNVIDTFFYQKE
ncbi:chemotaxis protein methyltransferase CheR [Virgibacillus natechei]|uniref:protein-glutamate O-methyltransferase n=1 Tax=Virgibacillus natechei TaxID=1216297 RepID=A0ABS4II00_9BACI|nr:protein-glutamate O-methyltransferase CheR [Virgibacillus natechei]MBP1969609.1 chemotaxis protein methyltransferase CheR [Virgibacillus natechei]UZD11340.1 protein-glutamate O-methyltransferase CheR [Virgibacillus natechei]